MSEIKLYDGNYVEIKDSDLDIVNNVIEQVNDGNQELIEQGYGVLEISFLSAFVVSKIIEDEKLPMYSETSFCDGLMHPMRSLGYGGIGVIYSKMDVDEERIKVFDDTAGFFNDIFRVQQSYFLGEERKEKNLDYMNQLKDNILAVEKDFSNMMTKQTDAFDELVKLYNVPNDRTLN